MDEWIRLETAEQIPPTYYRQGDDGRSHLFRFYGDEEPRGLTSDELSAIPLVHTLVEQLKVALELFEDDCTPDEMACFVWKYSAMMVLGEIEGTDAP